MIKYDSPFFIFRHRKGYINGGVWIILSDNIFGKSPENSLLCNYIVPYI